MSWPRPIMAFDTGVVYDQSALVVIWRLAGVSALNPGHDGRPVFVAFTHVWPPGTQLGAVVDAVVAVADRLRPRFIATETVGVGAMPSQELRRRVTWPTYDRPLSWCMVATTQAKKLAAYGVLRWLFERGQIVLGRDPAPLRQLAGLSLQQTAQGARIGAEDPAVHDDVADALAFAMLPYTPAGSSRIVCGMAELADPAHAVPEAPSRALDEPVVETGAGLRLYRRPPLQSVVGAEVWLPPDARLADDPSPPRPEMVPAPR